MPSVFLYFSLSVSFGKSAQSVRIEQSFRIFFLSPSKVLYMMSVLFTHHSRCWTKYFRAGMCMYGAMPGTELPKTVIKMGSEC